jgi:putative nucleotidyltransferase with HDIG domain
MKRTSTELKQKLFLAAEKMPAFPRSVQRILELTRDINCPPKELVKVIEQDPVLTMKLLRILNSAYYSFSKPVTSAHQAVVCLGLNTIKNLALSFAALGTLPEQNSAGFDMQRYLRHSLFTASLARTLCQQYSRDNTDPADCYITGLLHDIGKVVFALFLPAEFKTALAYSVDQSVPLYSAEQRIIGMDHTIMGAMLLEKWQFHEPLIGNILNHHGVPVSGNTIQNCLFAANQISNQLVTGVSSPALVDALSPVQVYFGCSPDELIANLGDISAIERETQIFAQIGNEDSA